MRNACLQHIHNSQQILGNRLLWEGKIRALNRAHGPIWGEGRNHSHVCLGLTNRWETKEERWRGRPLPWGARRAHVSWKASSRLLVLEDKVLSKKVERRAIWESKSFVRLSHSYCFIMYSTNKNMSHVHLFY